MQIVDRLDQAVVQGEDHVVDFDAGIGGQASWGYFVNQDQAIGEEVGVAHETAGDLNVACAFVPT